MNPRKRIYPYVQTGTYKQLKRHIAAHGASESAVVDAALRVYMSDATDEAVLFRRLDRHGRSLSKVTRDLQLLTEAFAIFVKIYMANSPRVADSDRANIEALAEQRYRQFCEYVAQQISGGHQFIDDLAEDLPVSTDELKEAVHDTATSA